MLPEFDSVGALENDPVEVGYRLFDDELKDPGRLGDAERKEVDTLETPEKLPEELKDAGGLIGWLLLYERVEALSALVDERLEGFGTLLGSGLESPENDIGRLVEDLGLTVLDTGGS